MMASIEPAPTAAADRQMVRAALQEAVKVRLKGPSACWNGESAGGRRGAGEPSMHWEQCAPLP
jgi:hypothetical protein